MDIITWLITLALAGNIVTNTGPVDPNPLQVQAIPAEQHFVEHVEYIHPIIWRYGCSPTAGAMLLSYWDKLGYDVIPGYFQTDASISQVAASDEHYQDYSLPLDFSGPILPDKSQLGGAHQSNSIADFSYTSWSSIGLRFPETYVFLVEDGIARYVSQYGYSAETNHYENNWEVFKNEIDNNRPVLVVFPAGSGYHHVVAFGYTDGYYASYNTWNRGITWYSFSNVTWIQTIKLVGTIKEPILYKNYLPVVIK